MADRPGFFRRFFGGLWAVLNFTRQLIFNVLFFAIVAVLLFAWFASDGPAAFRSEPVGSSARRHRRGYRSPARRAIAEAFGEQRFETRVRDGWRARRCAKDPQHARGLVLDDMRGAGIATLREIGAALERFKASGKPIYAWGENYGQGHYYLAAHANELYLHPAGALGVRGLEATRGYYKTLLDKLGVKVNAFQAGRYKSFSEPFTRTSATPEAKEADSLLLSGLWSTWTSDVERVRKLKPGTVDGVINDLPQRLAAAEGDIAAGTERKACRRLMTRSSFASAYCRAGLRAATRRDTFRQIPCIVLRARLSA